MDTWVSKLLAMIILGLSVFLVGISTIKLRKVLGLHATEVRRGQTIITSVLLCFGAGVLMATIFLHILPEAREGMLEHQEKLGIEYLTELVTCGGFFMVYLVEELVHAGLHYTRHREEFHKALPLRKAKDQSGSTCNEPAAQDCCEKDVDCHNDMEVGFSAGHNDMGGEAGYGTMKAVKKNPNDNDAKAKVELSLLRDFLTVFALCFHCTFEGLAVGLEKESADVWAMFTAITSHKLVITFCYSLEILNKVHSMWPFFSYLLSYSLVSPFGIGLGWIISQSGTVSDFTISAMQAIAGGTLLYVVMFEIIQREKEKDVSGTLQLVGILLGFALMTLLITYVEEPEDEEGEGGEEDPGAKATMLVNVLKFSLQKNYSDSEIY